MKRILLFLVFTIFIARVFAQADGLETLKKQYTSAVSYKEKVSALEQLAARYTTINFDSALYYTQKGLQLSLKEKDSVYTGMLKRSAGVAYYFKGQYDSAANYYYQSVSLLEHTNAKSGLALTYNEIAKLFRKTRNLDKALDYYNKSMDIYQQLKDSSGISMILNESGVVYEYMGQFEKAIDHYNGSLSIASGKKDSVGIGYALSFIGGAYTQLKKFDLASKYLNDCIEIRKRSKDSFTLALSYSDLGFMENEAGQLAASRQHFINSNEIASKMNYPELLSNNLKMMADLEEKSGNYKQSLQYYQQHFQLKDSLFSLARTKQIEELSAKYETAQKEKRIQEQQFELSKKNYWIIGGTILFALIILLSYSLYRRNQLKQEARLQSEILRQQDFATKAILEAEEKERQRIAKDLHDGVGQMMSAAKLNLSAIENEIPFKDDMQKEAMLRIIKLVDDSCKEVRAVSHNMMPNALLKAGLASAIREFINQIDQKIIKVNLHSEGLSERLDSNTETVLYRVIQECVNNVIKHAGAAQLDISLIKDEDGISATVEDNGKGFDTSDSLKKNGLGLKNIQARVEYLKGTVDFDSSPGKGTLVAIHVPLHNA
ncbi:MAG: tetratricopeptide repeat protein [Sphingobacteriales bacterium]|nr:tetratricopeptide repeat protein [Sphingobacteriales bacterium]MBI3720769.1 tetratricopeptide repeat protein [Sphingobacteriales bacterium]